MCPGAEHRGIVFLFRERKAELAADYAVQLARTAGKVLFFANPQAMWSCSALRHETVRHASDTCANSNGP
jgi:hypothetical protein